MSKFNVGDKVRYIGEEHENNPQWCPAVGTIGTIVKNIDAVDCYIQWPKGSTSQADCWYCNKGDIEVVKNEEMTNEEIWKMLRPKMEKNGLEIAGYLQDYTGEVGCYDEDDVHNAIALAYRSGYERAMKGRPFKIGEKKKKGGHWEPVDHNNLPKERTRVRCKKEYRECGYDKAIIQVGDLGVVKYLGRFGIKVDCPRTNFVWFGLQNKDIAQYFDMWVEDDE